MRRLAAAAAALLVTAAMAPAVGAEAADDVNQFLFTRRSNDSSALTFTAPGLGEPMQSLEARKLDETQVLATRGW